MSGGFESVATARSRSGGLPRARLAMVRHSPAQIAPVARAQRRRFLRHAGLRAADLDGLGLARTGGGPRRQRGALSSELRRRRRQSAGARRCGRSGASVVNVVEWAEANWILPETGRPIVLRPWQRRRRPPDGPRRLGRDKTLQRTSLASSGTSSASPGSRWRRG